MKPYNIFDFDGTLADSMYIWKGSAARLLRGCGKEPAPGLNQRLAHLNLTDSAILLKEEYGLAPTVEELVARVRGQVEEEYRLWVPLKPGAERVVRRIAALGGRLCVATSSEQALVESALSRLGLRECFAFVLTTRPGFGKDKPDVYREALARLGGDDPARAAVFEDSPTCVLTAAGAGFSVYALGDETNRPYESLLRSHCHAYLAGWEEWREDL